MARISTYVKDTDITKDDKVIGSDVSGDTRNYSFEEIFKKTGLKESEVIKIMRKELSPNSFKNWRKRVSGRKAKHRKLNELRNDHSLL